MPRDYTKYERTKDGRLKCPHQGCTKTYGATSRATMIDHRKTHAQDYKKPTERIKCTYDNCEKDFADVSGLRSHVNSKHKQIRPKRVSCKHEGCSKTYADSKGLWAHVQSVHKGVRYPCQDQSCGKTFTVRANRNRHCKAVHEEYKWSCKYCNRQFSDPGIRTRHEAAHENERKHRCGGVLRDGRDCKFAANEAGNLTHHRRNVVHRTPPAVVPASDDAVFDESLEMAEGQRWSLAHDVVAIEGVDGLLFGAAGDIISVLEVIDEEWIDAALGSHEGIVPRNLLGPRFS